MNVSTGWMYSGLTSFEAMNLGSPVPITMVVPESSAKLVNDIKLSILYQRRSMEAVE